ncbi:MAG: sortase [Actinomycetota bacterium]|nr:sortase [Actinomycetota bacterium]
MDKSFDKRVVRRRRQRVGFVVFVSLVTVALGGMLFFVVNPSQGSAGTDVVERVKTPELDEAPKVVADLEARRTEAAERAPVTVPDIPYNATQQEAKEMLVSEGLKLGDVAKEPSDEYDEGGVFFQDPLPAVEVKRDSSVGITLSSGPEKVAKKESDGKAPEPATNYLYLTVPKLGLEDNAVADTEDPMALDNGAIKLPSTAFPWQDNGNTYITAHRIGYAGTPSYNQFYDLPSMQQGDEVILSDANGTTYTYQVTDVFAVMPQDNWVTDPVVGRDMATLQTCVATVDDWWTITPGLLTSPPGPETARLVVQADRVDVQPA